MTTLVTDAVYDPRSCNYTFTFSFPLTALGTKWVEAEFGQVPLATVRLICFDVIKYGPAKYRDEEGTIASAMAHHKFDSTAEPLKFARARRAFSDACVAIHNDIMS